MVEKRGGLAVGHHREELRSCPPYGFVFLAATRLAAQQKPYGRSRNVSRRFQLVLVLFGSNDFIARANAATGETIEKS
jgi:hypothetical protein